MRDIRKLDGEELKMKLLAGAPQALVYVEQLGGALWNVGNLSRWEVQIVQQCFSRS